MSLKRLLLRYSVAIGLREWTRCSRIRPEVRVGATAFAGAVISPFVVFVGPAARLYWILTGRQLLRRLGLTPQPYVFVSPFPIAHPPEIRKVLERPEHNWDPGPDDIPRWLDVWTRLAQALYWGLPRGLKHPPPTIGR